jgi:hypothetical protein
VAQRSFDHFRQEQKRHDEVRQFLANRAALYRNVLRQHGI